MVEASPYAPLDALQPLLGASVELYDDIAERDATGRVIGAWIADVVYVEIDLGNEDRRLVRADEIWRPNEGK